MVKPHTEIGRTGQVSGLGAPAAWDEVEGMAAWSFSDQPGPRLPFLCSTFPVPGSGKETFHCNGWKACISPQLPKSTFWGGETETVEEPEDTARDQPEDETADHFAPVHHKPAGGRQACGTAS